jgi:hypothetical protein
MGDCYTAYTYIATPAELCGRQTARQQGVSEWRGHSAHAAGADLKSICGVGDPQGTTAN